MNGKREKHQYFEGFTLIEITIVMLIVGFLLAGASTVITAQLRLKQVADTKERRDEIASALADYVSVNKALPCRSDRCTG